MAERLFPLSARAPRGCGSFMDGACPLAIVECRASLSSLYRTLTCLKYFAKLALTFRQFRFWDYLSAMELLLNLCWLSLTLPAYRLWRRGQTSAVKSLYFPHLVYVRFWDAC